MPTNLSKFVSGYSTAENILKSFVTEMTVGTVDDAWKWDLIYPSTINDVSDSAIVKTVVVSGASQLIAYLELKKPKFLDDGSTENHHFMSVRYGTGSLVHRIMTTAPITPVEGDTYVDSTTAILHTFQNAAWTQKTLSEGTRVTNPEGNKFVVQGGALVSITPIEGVGTVLPDVSSYEEGDGFLLTDTATLHTVTSGSWDAGTVQSQGKIFYNTVDTKLYTVLADSVVDAGVLYEHPWLEDEVGEWADYSWFRRDTATTIKKWLPITYFMSVEREYATFVLMGDPNADFDDYIISWGYIGNIINFEGSDTDFNGNFALTVSSDQVPNYAQTYGDKTATCVTDIAMLKTRTGFPFQAHLLSMTTPEEFADKHILGPSNWTHKYHMSPAYIFNGVDGYRGELKGVIVTDRSSIVHLDQLIIDKDTVDEKVYQYFELNAPYSMLNNSANSLFGIAILKTTETVE